MPKVSIIIPVYNVEKYLDQCVQSVRNQTLHDIEIILVDDESPDGCPQMCDEYAQQDNRIKVVHKKNGGLGFARNSGLDVATGEYVTFLDSDDFVDYDSYEQLYNLAKLNKVDVLYYKLNRFSDISNVKVSKRTDELKFFRGVEIKELMLDVIASDISEKSEHKINCSSCTGLYRLNLIQDNSIHFHSERELISEDLVFNLDILKWCNKVAFNDTEYYHYRFNPGSLTNTVRLDRITKNLELSHYINNHLGDWELDKVRGKERSARLFIGYSRSFMNPILKSSLSMKEKNEWLDEVLNLSVWKELYKSYPWTSLPLYAKVHFFAVVKKIKSVLFLIAHLR